MTDSLSRAYAARLDAADPLAGFRTRFVVPDEDLVNALAQYLEFEPMEKLALLERNGPLARCRSMVELLEMKALVKDRPEDSGMIH